MTDICIIGGGASGLAAAVAARMQNPGAAIRIIEKKDKTGSKLLATGSGRCNFTNTACEESGMVLAFFEMIGVKARVEEQGRIYPFNGQAKDVLFALESYINMHNVEVITNFGVEELAFSSGEIVVCRGKERFPARKALIATGGKAGPQFGSIGDGYRMARQAGHTVTKTIPSLSPVECEGNFSGLSGIRAKAAVTLLKKGEALFAETGEVQFTEYGLSGICVFDLSRFIRLDGADFSDYAISVDFFPGLSEGELDGELRLRAENPAISAENLLLSLVPRGLSDFVLKKAGGGAANAGETVRIAHTLKNLKFTVSGVKGWKSAQCTSGGVPLSEINMDTMESKIVKGLFFAGEIIDYDGPCGGYNLNNAWVTGIRAGRAMASDV